MTVIVGNFSIKYRKKINVLLSGNMTITDYR